MSALLLSACTRACSSSSRPAGELHLSGPAADTSARAEPDARLADPPPLSETLEALRKFKTDNLEAEVPAEVGPLLKKHRERIDQTLAVELARLDVKLDAEAVSSALRTAFRTRGAPVGAPEGQDAALGQLLELRAERAAGLPELLLVTTTYMVVCGQSTALSLFTPRDGRWVKRYQLEASGEAGTDAGLEGLDFLVLPPRPDRTFYLVATWSTPWCTSCWNSLFLKVIRFDADGRVLSTPVETSEGFYRCDESEEPRLKAAGDGTGFSLHYLAHSMDTALWGRQARVRYGLEGDRARLHPAPGASPTDTVDTWLRLPWTDAERWVLPGADRGALERRHAALKGDASATFDLVQPCVERKDAVLTGLTFDDSGGNAASSWYFLLRRRDGILYLEEVSQVRPGGCPGDTAPAQAP